MGSIETKYSAEEFRKICNEVIPIIEKLEKIIPVVNEGEFFHIDISSDGFVHMYGGCLGGWDLCRQDTDGEYSASFVHREEFVRHDEQACV